MKKLFMSIIVIGVISTNAIAIEGKVEWVLVKADGTITVKVSTFPKQLVGTAEAIKAMYAAALTAKNSGATVSVGAGDYDSKRGWNLFQVL